MKYKTKADLFALLHLFWFVIGIASFIAVVFFNTYKLIAIIFVLITLTSQLIWQGCVFHIWEKQFRHKHNPTYSYEGGFVRHYLKKLFGLNVSEIFIRLVIYTFLGILLLFSIN